MDGAGAWAESTAAAVADTTATKRNLMVRVIQELYAYPLAHLPGTRLGSVRSGAFQAIDDDDLGRDAPALQFQPQLVL